MFTTPTTTRLLAMDINLARSLIISIAPLMVVGPETINDIAFLNDDLFHARRILSYLLSPLLSHGYLNQMWAMCLLYLGPNFRPGVEHDYHLSPILAPSELLAAFPPVLLQCGGRDPLVDDTMHFAGRLKEAKRKVRAQRFQKRHTTVVQLPTPQEEREDAPEIRLPMSKGDEEGVEDVEETVKVQIFPGWSHGYLQMSSIMREAKFAIDDIADWMQETFERNQPRRASLTPTISVAQF